MEWSAARWRERQAAPGGLDAAREDRARRRGQSVSSRFIWVSKPVRRGEAAVSIDLRKLVSTVLGGLILAGIIGLFNLSNRVASIEGALKYLHGENVLKEGK
jgi:hypothetical protein